MMNSNAESQPLFSDLPKSRIFGELASARIATRPRDLPREQHAEIEFITMVKASPNAVWAVLTDFGGYPLWESFVHFLSGPPPFVSQRLGVDKLMERTHID